MELEKVTLYKINKEIDEIEQILSSDGYTVIDDYNTDEIKIYQKAKDIYDDYALPFLNNNVQINRYVYIVLIKDINCNSFYWFRRGSDKSKIDGYKNINFGFYYLANCSDHEQYEVISKKTVEFSIFHGEAKKTTVQERNNILLSEFLEGLDAFSESVEEVTVLVREGSKIYNDLKLNSAREITVKNGITIFLDLTENESLNAAKEICENISNTFGLNRTGAFKKLRKSNVSLDSNIEPVSLFKITTKSILKMDYVNIHDTINEQEKYFGMFKKDSKLYYINIQQKKYKVDFDTRQHDLINYVPDDSAKRILNALGVMSYINEDNFIEQVNNKNNNDILVHVFHKYHYCKTTRSKFELCDVLLYDKTNDLSYLIFIKYEFIASSSEVFWQSSFISSEFKQNSLEEDKLKKYLEKASFRYGVDYFKELFYKAKYVNLILPKGENRNTNNLNHVYSLLKGFSGREKFDIVIPETSRRVDDYTSIINL